MGNQNLSSISSKSFLIGSRSITAIYNTYAGYENDKYIDDDGSIVSYDGYAISGKIPVSQNDIVTIPIHATDGTDKHGGIYDSSDTWIAKLDLKTTIPANASYIRFNVNKGFALNLSVCYVYKGESYTNKIVVCDGDSITEGFSTNKPYPEFLQDGMNISIENLGVGGSKISETLGRIESIPLGASQYVLNIGYNDFDQATTLGTISDSTSATFSGCLNLIIDWMRKNRAFCEIYVCNLFRSPNAATIGGGSTLKQFSDAIVSICSNKGVRLIDSWNCGLNFADATNAKVFSVGDNLHPNTQGNMIISRLVYKEII